MASQEETTPVIKIFSDYELSLANQGDVGYDIKSLNLIYLIPFNPLKINTGIYMQFPTGYYGQIEGRSSLAKKGIIPLGGIIDTGYRGEIIVILVNNTIIPHYIEKGEKIAQIIIRKKNPVIFEYISQKPMIDTERGEKSFGSSNN